MAITTTVTFAGDAGPALLSCELAATARRIELGLAFHPGLGPNEGLLYAFAEPSRVGFWSKDVDFTIDQIFVSAAGRVVSVATREPGAVELVAPPEPCAYVVEAPGGFSVAHGIAPGVAVAFDGLEPALEAARVEAAATAQDGLGWVVFVECDQSGLYLVRELRRRGASCMHVRFTGHLEQVGPDDFEAVIVRDESAPLAPLVDALRGRGVVACFAGSETGVELADALNEALSLRGNGAGSAARRNKFAMVEATRQAGLRATRQLRATSADEVIAWMAREGLAEVVIKPARSAGSDRVVLATSADEVRAAAARILGATNKLQLVEHELVAQERIVGEEHFVNCVSRDGEHYVTEIWRSPKRAMHGMPFTYDVFELVPADLPTSRALAAWMPRALDALGVRWGPSHTEVMATAEGPVLVESGARLDGLLLPDLNVQCSATSIVELVADAYFDPTAWAIRTRSPYRLRRRAMTVVLANQAAGEVMDDRGLAALRALPSYYAHRMRARVGGWVQPTVDAFTYMGTVSLVHESRAQLVDDLAALRDLEARAAIFDVVPALVEVGEPAGDEAASLVEALATRADLRQSEGWSRVMARLGWEPITIGSARALSRRDPQGDVLALQRPREVELAALDAAWHALGEPRVILEPALGGWLWPIASGPLALARTADLGDAGFATLAEHGLVRTRRSLSPGHARVLRAADAPMDALAAASAAGYVVSGSAAAALSVEAVLAAFGATEAEHPTARFVAALARELAESAWLVTARRGEVTLGAVFAAGCDRVAHVLVAGVDADVDDALVEAALAAELARVAAGAGCDLVVLGAAPDARLGEPLRPPSGFDLPASVPVHWPLALTWRRPAWARELGAPTALGAAIGLRPDPPESRPDAAELVARWRAREHPYTTWRAAEVMQDSGWRCLVADGGFVFAGHSQGAFHGVVPRAPRVRPQALARLQREHELAWIGVEPGLDITIHGDDGAVEALAFEPRDAASWLATMHRHGLHAHAGRWLHRRTFLLDLAGGPEAVLARLPKKRRYDVRHVADGGPRVELVAGPDIGRSLWARIEDVHRAWREGAAAPDDWVFGRAVARHFGDAVEVALGYDDRGVAAFAIFLHHADTAHYVFAASHPRARALELPTALLWRGIVGATRRGADVLDFLGGWDPRFPEERTGWQGFTRFKALWRPVEILYPPTVTP